MERFNYRINEPNEGNGDALDLGFINRSDFSGSDVDVLYEAQQSLLRGGDIGSMSGGVDVDGCHEFLNPITDILGDINEFSKNFCCDGDQVSAAVVSLQGGGGGTGQLNCSWSGLQDASGENVATTQSYVNIAEVGKDVDGNDSSLFSIGGGNAADAAAIEFSASDCAFGGEYSSTISQWLQSLEQQQMSFMSTNLPLPTTTVGYSDSFLSTIGSLPMSTTITPIMVEEHQLHHQRITSASPPQQELTIETRFFPEKVDGGSCNSILLAENSSFAEEDLLRRRNDDWRYLQSSAEAVVASCLPPMSFTAATVASNNLLPISHKISNRKSTAATAVSSSALCPATSATLAATPCPPRIPRIGFQKSRLHWTAVFPRKQFIQPPEMIIMHPLRTRKLMKNSRRTATATAGCAGGGGDGSTINLSEYFDTSSIHIPMISERSQGRNENRRKQKLNIIPGSENLIFEVQRNEFNDLEEFVQTPTSIGEQFNAEVDPYPETELPELDEIFRRKKKTISLPAAGSKRSYSIIQPTCGGIGLVAGTPPQKKQNQNISAQQLSAPASVQESSASFEEKISVSIAVRKGRSNLSIDKNDLILSSESDSGGSNDDDAADKSSAQHIGKSLKCLKCRKLFKTTRSLAIHTKRCTAVQRATSSPSYSQFVEEDANNNKSNNGKHAHNPDVELANLPKLNRIHPEDTESLEISICCSDNSEDQINSKIPLLGDSNDKNKPRPITRSQTRRSTGRSIQLTNTKLPK